MTLEALYEQFASYLKSLSREEFLAEVARAAEQSSNSYLLDEMNYEEYQDLPVLPVTKTRMMMISGHSCIPTPKVVPTVSGSDSFQSYLADDMLGGQAA